jgi:hypothetical protein
MASAVRIGTLIAVLFTAVPLPAEEHRPGAVVFVCEHGSVKSVIAALWFNRLASERGLRLQSVSRGVDPDPKVPDWVVPYLRNDGFDLTGVVPVRLQSGDVTQAVHVVAIGANSPFFDALGVLPERWDDIPPTSADYRASRDAMRLRLGTLVDALVRKQSTEQRP